jgi:Arc/MetJ-type ribon-helix-helix transcriptional regulator
MSKNTTRLTVDLDDDLHKEIRRLCLLDLDTSMAQYIRDLIQQDLDRRDV